MIQLTKFRLQFNPSLFLLILLFCLSLSLPPVIAQTHPTTAEQLIQQGRQYYNIGQFKEAISFWQEAIKNLPNHSLNQAMAWSNLSLTYQQLGNWEKAHQSINQSLTILHSLKSTPEQQRILAQTLDIQGQLFYQTGQSQEALNTWIQATRIHPNLEDKKLSQINQAQAMEDLGLYPRACQTLLKTLDLDDQECSLSQSELSMIQSEIAHHSGQTYQIKALRSLGNVFRVIGDLQQSQRVLQASLNSTPNPPIENLSSLDSIQSKDLKNLSQDEIKTLLNLGNTEQALAVRGKEINDLQQIRTSQANALNYYQKVINLSASSPLKIQAKLNLAELFIEQKEWQNAQDLLSQIEEELIDLTNNQKTIYANINYTKNLLCLHQKDPNCLNPQQPNLSLVNDTTFQIAVSQLEKANQDAVNLQDKQTQSYAAGLLGRLYESRQTWTLAQSYTQQALQLSWQAQSPTLTYQWQWQQGRLLKAQGKHQEALKAYESAIKTLNLLRSDLVSINPEIQFTFRESIEPVYREYVSLLLQPSGRQDTSPENLKLARETIDSLQLAELENFFRLVCLDAKPVIIDQVTDQNDPTAAVIYPILLEDRFEIILKLPQQSLRHYTTSIDDSKVVERILGRLAQSLTQANSQETLPLAQQVYDWLLRPVQEDLAQSDIKTLVFVLDSALRNVPMSVLHDGQQYLVEKYSIALIPSLQLLDPKPLKQKQKKALFAGLSEARDKFPPLPFVPQELEQIQAQVPASVELFNQTFTNEQFRETINSAPFSVVHLATHGQFSSQLDNTFILTWDNRLNVNQLNDLIRSNNAEPIELLVLSACETLTGDKRASLGLAGVAIRAGARSTLATLWQVNDQTTAILMNQFYTALNDSTVTKANALRQAQLALLEDPIYQRPHFWAAYVLVGNWL